MHKCKKHKGYKAIRKPKVDCIQCWYMWVNTCRSKNIKSIDQAFVDSSELFDAMNTFQSLVDEKAYELYEKTR